MAARPEWMTVLSSRCLMAMQLLLAEERQGFAEVGDHANRVGGTARKIAQAAGVPSDDVELLVLAARFHDIGKCRIAPEILNKPGRLDPSERAEMERHAAIGADLLAGLPGVPQVMVDVARYHHERHDGWGYERLAGEDVPYCARIVAIADCHDALLSPRAYKPAMAEGEVLSILTADVASPGFGRRAFDPVLLRLFVSLRLADPSLVASDEQKHALSTFAASDPGLDLSPEARELVEFDDGGGRRIYERDGDDRRLARAIGLSGEPAEHDQDYAPSRLAI